MKLKQCKVCGSVYVSLVGLIVNTKETAILNERLVGEELLTQLQCGYFPSQITLSFPPHPQLLFSAKLKAKYFPLGERKVA